MRETSHLTTPAPAPPRWFMFTKRGKKVVNPRAYPLLRFFFLKPICKKMQSNPELIDHLGLPMPIHFLKINSNVLQWLGTLQSSNSFTFASENLSEKVFGWRFFDGKNDWSNIFKKTHVFQKKWINTNVFFWINMFFKLKTNICWINSRFF